MSYSIRTASSQALRLLALFSAATLWCFSAPLLGAQNTVTPYAVCSTYNPDTGKLQLLLGYTSTYPSNVILPAGSAQNFFQPGTADLGQPQDFDSGTDGQRFVVSFFPDYSDLSWVVNQNTLPLTRNSAPPCRPSYFTSGPGLTYAAPGTYPSQFLGSISTSGANPTATVLPVANAAGLSVTNVQTTAAPSVGSIVGPLATYSFYGDVTVAPGPPTSTALLVQVMSNGVQLALGQTALSFSGTPADTTGCPTTVTNLVAGKVGPARQLLDTGIWTQVVTFKNNSGTAIPGPIQLALTNLSPNAKLFTAAGTGTCPSIAGAPYITVTNGLKAKGNAAVVLTFTNSGEPSTAITYTPVVVSGGSKL